MRAERLDLGTHSRRPRARHIFALAGAVVMTLAAGRGALISAQAWGLAEDELARVTARVQATRAEQLPLAVAAAAKPLQAAELELLARLQAPWDQALVPVERATGGLNGEVSITSIHESHETANGGELLIAGLAVSAESVLSLVESLSRQPGCDRARLISQTQDVEQSSPLTFQLELRCAPPGTRPVLVGAERRSEG